MLSHTSIPVTFDKLHVGVCDGVTVPAVEQSNLFDFISENVELVPGMEKVLSFHMPLLPEKFQTVRKIFVSFSIFRLFDLQFIF